MLEWLNQFLRPLAQQAGVQLELCHHLDGVEVRADRHGLEQVVLNLALNALRFMPRGGVLKVTGGVQRGCSGASAKVEITDTGCGISAENIARIFAPGFTTRAGSPGLGLAVCQTIMQQHRGSIAVTSRPREGSRFTLDFPLLNRTSGDVARHREASSGRAAHTRTSERNGQWR